jgi:hypothetical protein
MSHEIHKLTRGNLVFSPRGPPSSRQGVEAVSSGWLRPTEGLSAVEWQLGIPRPAELHGSQPPGCDDLAGGSSATGHDGQEDQGSERGRSSAGRGTRW